MGFMLELAFVVLLVGVLVASLMYYRRARDGAPLGANAEEGTLYVHGVSPHPQVTGEQYVTLTGTISGPSVVAHEVYGRFAWDTAQWPSIGDQIAVVYPAGKPDSWSIAHPGARPYFGSKQSREQQGAGQQGFPQHEQLNQGPVGGPGQDPLGKPDQPGQDPFRKPDQPGDQRY